MHVEALLLHAEAALLQIEALLLHLKALLLPFRQKKGYFLLFIFYFHEKLQVFREPSSLNPPLPA